MADRPWWKPRNAPGDDYKPPQPRPPESRRPPPAVPENRGDQQWWQDRRVPRQMQDQTEPRDRPPQRKPQAPPRRDGQGSADAYGSATPEESARMLRGAFQAGMNGDDGALQSFPNTPLGQRLRQEFMRGRQARQTPGRGLGFSQMDRS